MITKLTEAELFNKIIASFVTKQTVQAKMTELRTSSRRNQANLSRNFLSSVT